MEARHNEDDARRLEYAPDRDGMASLSAYLPADTAAGYGTAPPARRARCRAQRKLAAGGATRRRRQRLALRAENRMDGPGGIPAGSGRAGEVPTPTAQVLVTVPVFSLLRLTGDRPSWMSTGRSRRPWLGGSSRTGHPRPARPYRPTRARRWRSAEPATGSRKDCGNGCGSATDGAPSQAATTSPWTQTPITSSPRPTAAEPESVAWADHAASPRLKHTTAERP